MTAINVYGAGDRVLAQKTDTGADCLKVAWTGIGQGKASQRGHNTPTAIAEWNATPGKVKGKLPPHAGYPGYFAGPSGYGDVAVYLGNGNWAGIDSKDGRYHFGTINPQTTAQRAAQVGGAYLGYSTEMLGYNLNYTVPAVDRTTIPTDVQINAGEGYNCDAYRFSVEQDGSTTVTVIATGHVHVAFKRGPGVGTKDSAAGTFVIFQGDGNLVGYYLDQKGKRHVVFQSGTNRKAAGGQMVLDAKGALVIFNKKHVIVKKWG